MSSCSEDESQAFQTTNSNLGTKSMSSVSELNELSSVQRNPSESSSHSSMSSIRSKKLSGSKQTPIKCFNPFDVGLEKLRGTYFSPNVFACKSNAKNDQVFRWSIDQLADLQPTDIDESSHQEIHGVDSETEELAQTAISEFFSKNKVAPSPWTCDSKVESSIPKPHHVTFSPHLASTAYYERYEDVLNSSENEIENTTKQSAWTQTVLTFPPNLNLEKTLAQFFTFTENQQRPKTLKNEFEIFDDVNKDYCLPFRRKLFSHDGQSEERGSGLTCRLHPAGMESPPVSPKVISTPGSSSPITPCYERKVSGNFPCSSSVLSPVVSPIPKSAFKTPSTGSLRNEGIFRISSTQSSYDLTPKKGSVCLFKEHSQQRSVDSSDFDPAAMDDNSSPCFMAASLSENSGKTDVTNQFESMSTDFSKSNASRLQPNDMECCDDHDDHDTGYSTQPLSITDKTSASLKGNSQDVKCLLDRSDDFSRSSKVIKIAHEYKPSYPKDDMKWIDDFVNNS